MKPRNIRASTDFRHVNDHNHNLGSLDIKTKSDDRKSVKVLSKSA
jgi:hypothetical protein